MTAPALVTYLGYVNSYASPIASLASCYTSLVAAIAGAERVFEVLDTPHETDEGKVTLVRIIKNAMGETEETDSAEGSLVWKIPTENGFMYKDLKGNIEVKNVTFAYVEGTDVLKNINVDAPGGTKVAFVGSTGAGKTTITNLINRFYEVGDGEITYDGIPIKEKKKIHSVAQWLWFFRTLSCSEEQSKTISVTASLMQLMKKLLKLQKLPTPTHLLRLFPMDMKLSSEKAETTFQQVRLSL